MRRRGSPPNLPACCWTLFARIGTGRLKSRLRDCPLWQVRASAAAALGLRARRGSRKRWPLPARPGCPGARRGAAVWPS